MKNFIQDGDTLTVPAPTDGVDGGELVVVGSLAGVAIHTAAEGDDVEVKTSGVYELAKTSAQAWAIGQKIYATSAGVATSAASGNTLIGFATAVAANPSSVGSVKIGPTI